MTDPAVQAAIAAGQVPDDISEAFLNESHDVPLIAAIIISCILTFFVICARTVSRVFMIQSFGLDDWLALLSMALLIAFTTNSVILIRTGMARHAEYLQYVLTEETVQFGETLDGVGFYVFTTALLVCRLSGLTFYHRLCGLHDRLRLIIQVVLIFHLLSFVVQILVNLVHCLPITIRWPSYWEDDADQYKCLSWFVVYGVNVSVSLFCDLLIFGIPVAMIFMLEMPRKRKLLLASILFPGVLVLVISVGRAYIIFEGDSIDEMNSYGPIIALEAVEIGATLTALSFPAIRRMLDDLLTRKRLSSLGNSSTAKVHHSRALATPDTFVSARGASQSDGNQAQIEEPVQVPERQLESPSADYWSLASTDEYYVHENIVFEMKGKNLSGGRNTPFPDQ